ncbi:segregation and condensation protein B [Ligilactobacillus sp. WC1T17]|uniref:Segregation and condensation protein B n=1 Tax=Ligilactobacillus ruminis TaxID=1623 RepID=A0ABY1ABK8_9LACO|nr:segregation and condensation protein B [Ligilactobacillus ruminis]
MLSNQAKIESLLFVSGADGISATQLAQLTGLLKPAVYAQINKLNEKYQADHACSVEIIEANERFRLVTKKSFAPLLKEYFAAPATTEISGASLETLAIVAYKQPVTRLQIEEIRGVQSGGVIQKLLLLELISEAGRLDAPGRPILYQTTDTFLDYFGLNSLKELPPLPQDDAEATDQSDNFMELFSQTLGQTTEE